MLRTRRHHRHHHCQHHHVAVRHRCQHHHHHCRHHHCPSSPLPTSPSLSPYSPSSPSPLPTSPLPHRRHHQCHRNQHRRHRHHRHRIRSHCDSSVRRFCFPHARLEATGGGCCGCTGGQWRGPLAVASCFELVLLLGGPFARPASRMAQCMGAGPQVGERCRSGRGAFGGGLGSPRRRRAHRALG